MITDIMMSTNDVDNTRSAADPLPDESLVERIHRALQQTGYHAHRSLRVAASGDQISIFGQTPSFYERQVAIHCVMSLTGTLRVVDQISVSEPTSIFRQ